jgi:hypothetical protein
VWREAVLWAYAEPASIGTCCPHDGGGHGVFRDRAMVPASGSPMGGDQHHGGDAIDLGSGTDDLRAAICGHRARRGRGGTSGAVSRIDDAGFRGGRFRAGTALPAPSSGPRSLPVWRDHPRYRLIGIAAGGRLDYGGAPLLRGFPGDRYRPGDDCAVARTRPESPGVGKGSLILFFLRRPLQRPPRCVHLLQCEPRRLARAEGGTGRLQEHAEDHSVAQMTCHGCIRSTSLSSRSDL